MYRPSTSPDLCQIEGPPTEVTPCNIPRHILPQSPLAPIREHSQFTRFAPPPLLTPYEPLAREPPPRYPTSSPARGMPNMFREPYPVANPPMAPAAFVHSPDPQPVSGDSPLVAVTCRFTRVEEEYLHT